MEKKLFTLLLSCGLVFSAVGCERTNNAPSNPDGEEEQHEGEGGDEKTLSSIAVTANPTKVTYEVGENFASAGLVVTATYSDQSKEAVTGYTLNPAEGYTFVEADMPSKEFTVTYQEKTAKFTVTVNAATPVETKVDIVLNDFFPNLGTNESADFGTKSESDVSLTAAKGTGTNDPKFYHNEASLRLYPGNTFIVSAENITKIEITEASDYGGKTRADLSADVGRFANNVWSGKSNSVTFTVDSSGKQFRISSLKITLNGEGGDDPIVPATEEWSSSIQNALNSVVGELIPYIKLANASVETEEDEEGPYVYIYDENGQDQVEAYKGLLVEAGYAPDGEELDEDYDYTAYFYTKEIDHLDGEKARHIVVQVDYFPGNSSYDPCFEIYAWIRVTYPSLTEWSSDDVSLMLEYVGEALPFAEDLFTTQDYWQFNDDNSYLELISGLDEDGVDSYIAELEKTFEAVEGKEGYFVKVSSADSGFEVVVYAAYGFYYDEDTGDYGYYASIYAFMQMIPVQVESWPAEEIQEFLPADASSVPSFDGLESYEYTNDNGFVVSLGEITDEQKNAYLDKLVAANYYIQYTNYEDFGMEGGEYYQAVSWLEDVIIYLDDSNGVNDWTIFIYETEPSYSSIEENFPTELVLSKFEGVESVPAFESITGYKVVSTKDASISLEGIVENVDSFAESFKSLLEGKGYEVIYSDEDDLFTAKNEDLEVKIEYYFVGNYLEITYSAYLAVGEVITLNASDMPTKYDDIEAEHTMQGIKLMTTSVMNQSNKIQFKKNVGVLRNADALASIAYIKIVGANKDAQDETIKMEAGLASDSLTEITATQDGDDLIYELDGATFFKFSNCGTGVFTCSSIEIAFAK